jgi:tRNA threonylcarbamoyladenosine biosynthesis protein TsaE
LADRWAATADPGSSSPGRTLELESTSPEVTRSIAARLATVAVPGDLVCLWGDLGAGKTVFAKGFGAGLGVEATISSPSFVLMGEYAGRLPLFHIDLYRLSSATEALDGGLLDDRQVAGVVLVEWPDRLEDAIPPDRLDVRIDGGGDEPRRLLLGASGTGYERYLDAVQAPPVAARATTAGPATTTADRGTNAADPARAAAAAPGATEPGR